MKQFSFPIVKLGDHIVYLLGNNTIHYGVVEDVQFDEYYECWVYTAVSTKVRSVKVELTGDEILKNMTNGEVFRSFY